LLLPDVTHISRLKCTRFDFGWGSTVDPAGGAHSTLQDPLTRFEGVILLREGKGRGGEEKEERGRKGRGKVASWLGGDVRLWCDEKY